MLFFILGNSHQLKIILIVIIYFLQLKLIEGTHYIRRMDQPSPHPIRAKELVDCMFYRLPSDSEDEVGRAI